MLEVSHGKKHKTFLSSCHHLVTGFRYSPELWLLSSFHPHQAAFFSTRELTNSASNSMQTWWAKSSSDWEFSLFIVAHKRAKMTVDFMLFYVAPNVHVHYVSLTRLPRYCSYIRWKYGNITNLQLLCWNQVLGKKKKTF